MATATRPSRTASREASVLRCGKRTTSRGSGSPVARDQARLGPGRTRRPGPSSLHVVSGHSMRAGDGDQDQDHDVVEVHGFRG
ncbi:hypothetical protein DRB96_41695 [Streptomyces sp. ICC1]|nr:hypothetical protein DRB89_38805 [Streptomyces sp. ICC4]AWZ17520.1 hypothetical protein DRB96_41695 [Streptomyces sp. ICC1]